MNRRDHDSGGEARPKKENCGVRRRRLPYSARPLLPWPPPASSTRSLSRSLRKGKGKGKGQGKSKNKRKRKRMPSLQASLPPELADNVIRLYRECLRRAKYIGQQKHNTELLVNMVRQQFKRHKDETDPEKIQKLKDDAARGLINHILYESEQLTGRSVFKTK
ncbi:COMPLEX 1 LYR-like protein [Rhynchospora pubera]|uniref:COMPLEX 1 LYR-like protein n=1 Tax=Rhynchospora pubera TaxID=906938 RepID=A0AAV8GW86_9POAL|nr:COMPLEX 1 LYR-like protein [Rhynchospora pubera]